MDVKGLYGREKKKERKKIKRKVGNSYGEGDGHSLLLFNRISLRVINPKVSLGWRKSF